MGSGEMDTGDGLHQGDMTGFEMLFEVGWEHAGFAGDEEEDDVGHLVVSLGVWGSEYGYGVAFQLLFEL